MTKSPAEKRMQIRCTEAHCSFNWSPPNCPTCQGTGWQWVTVKDTTMKTPAEKCAERIVKSYGCGDCDPCCGGRPDQCAVPVGLIPVTIAAIIQSEYAPKSPDKCAEQAAEGIVKKLYGVSDGVTLPSRQVAIAAIITESYAPTIQVAREAISAALDELNYMKCACVGDVVQCLPCQLRTALEQLPK